MRHKMEKKKKNRMRETENYIVVFALMIMMMADTVMMKFKFLNDNSKWQKKNVFKSFEMRKIS